MPDEKRKGAAWTPWAEVLCADCHGPTNKLTGENVSEWFSRRPRKSDGPGYCTRCGAAVWVDEAVAHLTRIRKQLGKGEMNQTGGMCSALSVLNDAGTHCVVVTTQDVDLFLGYYTKEGWNEASDKPIAAYSVPEGTSLEDECAVIQAVLDEEDVPSYAKKIAENGEWL
jgi:hypothetical protein